MINNSQWLMAEDALTNLIDLMNSADRSMPAIELPESLVEHDNYTEFKMRGPVVSRANWITEILGIQSTEQLMSDFETAVDIGKPILMDIDGPGGEALLAFEFADMIYQAGDQVTAYTNGVAASAHMLFFQAAQGGRYAHDSAMLGSIGVIGYVPPNKQEMGIVTSKNADNKYPDESAVKTRINQLESIFTQRLSSYTSMSAEQIVENGNEGSVFTGNYAKSVGFVDETIDRKSITSSLMSKPDSSATDAAANEANAVAATNERWGKIMSHPKAKDNFDLARSYAELPISVDQAIALLDQAKDAKPAAKIDISIPPKQEDKAADESIEDKMNAMFETFMANHSAKVDSAKSDTDIADEPEVTAEAKDKSDAERGARAAERAGIL